MAILGKDSKFDSRNGNRGGLICTSTSAYALFYAPECLILPYHGSLCRAVTHNSFLARARAANSNWMLSPYEYLYALTSMAINDVTITLLLYVPYLEVIECEPQLSFLAMRKVARHCQLYLVQP